MLSDIELTILSLVAEGRRYGAEIERAIEERGLRDWLRIGSSSVYYVLKKLTTQSLVWIDTADSAAESVGSESVVYCISEAGRGVLGTALMDRLRQPPPMGGGIELALANLHALKPAQVYQALIHRRADLQTILNPNATSESDSTADEWTDAIFTHRAAAVRAEMEWLDDFIERWRARYPAVVSGQTLESIDSAGSNNANGAATLTHPATGSNERAKQLQRIKKA